MSFRAESVSSLEVSEVFLIIIWLNVQVELLTNNPLIHLQNFFTCTLEVTGRVVRGRDPETQLFHVLVHRLKYSAH